MLRLGRPSGRSNIVLSTFPTSIIVAALATLIAAGCVETRGTAWMQEVLAPDEPSPAERPAIASTPLAARRDRTTATRRLSVSPERSAHEEGEDDAPPPSSGRLLGTFRNTYYSFPDAADFTGADATLYDAACTPIATVPKDFHDRLCVQGSGRIAGGRTVSFAKRGCDCASLCPRTGQKICYEALDPARFPWGRGAAGKPITPFRSIAVDTSIIPLGTPVFISAFAGKATPDGWIHDGCFVAIDRGLKVVGQSVDVFTGSEKSTATWNALVGTGVGVEIYADDARCRADSPPR